MDSATFSANLRAEMARQGLVVDPNALCHMWFKAFPKSEQEHYRIWLHRVFVGMVAPENEIEVARIATALGCPEERLTVSREELEAELARVSQMWHEQNEQRKRYGAAYETISRQVWNLKEAVNAFGTDYSDLEKSLNTIAEQHKGGWSL